MVLELQILQLQDGKKVTYDISQLNELQISYNFWCRRKLNSHEVARKIIYDNVIAIPYIVK